MGGKGSGGHNKKSADEHFRDGTYRADRHGPLPKGLTRQERARIKKLAAKHDREQLIPKADLMAAKRKAAGSAIEPPAWFDDIARAEWIRVCDILVDKGTIQDVNHASLEGYCVAYSKVVQADTVIKEKGMTIKIPLVVEGDVIYDKKGEIVIKAERTRPEVAILAKFLGQVKMFGVELGITSSAGKDKEKKEISSLERLMRE